MIEDLITKLVREAPARDAQTVEDLIAALQHDGTPLALAISRIVELVADDLVDPGIALPALAEACATLVHHAQDAHAISAARYQIDTLQPVPDRPVVAAPDVPLSSLRKR